MAIMNGGFYTRAELLARTGNIAQLAEVRPAVLREGKAAGVRVLDITTGGGLSFTLLQDKGLDMFHLAYKGVNFCFHAKPGVVQAGLADLYGMGGGFLRSIAGGMFYTCGLSNNGGACTDAGVDHVFNGRIRNIPAEKVAVISAWDGDDYLLGADGEMRDTGLFCENLVLRRSVRTKLGAKSLTVTDTVSNEGFSDAYCMLMYHINLGFPIVDDGTQILLPENRMTPLNDTSAAMADRAETCTAPVPGSPENAFVRDMAVDADGMSAAAAYNAKLGLGLYVKYRKDSTPNLIEWKSMASGDYVLGLHVANSLFGRTDEIRRGTLQTIPSMGARVYTLELGVLDGDREAEDFRQTLSAYTLSERQCDVC